MNRLNKKLFILFLFFASSFVYANFYIYGMDEKKFLLDPTNINHKKKSVLRLVVIKPFFKMKKSSCEKGFSTFIEEDLKIAENIDNFEKQFLVDEFEEHCQYILENESIEKIFYVPLYFSTGFIAIDKKTIITARHSIEDDKQNVIKFINDDVHFLIKDYQQNTIFDTRRDSDNIDNVFYFNKNTSKLQLDAYKKFSSVVSFEYSDQYLNRIIKIFNDENLFKNIFSKQDTSEYIKTFEPALTDVIFINVNRDISELLTLSEYAPSQRDCDLYSLGFPSETKGEFAGHNSNGLDLFVTKGCLLNIFDFIIISDGVEKKPNIAKIYELNKENYDNLFFFSDMNSKSGQSGAPVINGLNGVISVVSMIKDLKKLQTDERSTKFSIFVPYIVFKHLSDQYTEIVLKKQKK